MTTITSIHTSLSLFLSLSTHPPVHPLAHPSTAPPHTPTTLRSSTRLCYLFERHHIDSLSVHPPVHPLTHPSTRPSTHPQLCALQLACAVCFSVITWIRTSLSLSPPTRPPTALFSSPVPFVSAAFDECLQGEEEGGEGEGAADAFPQTIMVYLNGV